MTAESTITRPMLATNRESISSSMRHLTHDHELFSNMSDDIPKPLSETVTTLASNVYKELERIIRNFGENSVKDLMPVMISTLESLDNALHERDVSKLENDSLKEQNEQLFQQYEREKNFHKEYQQRYSQIEDHLEELKRNHEEKLSSLESIVKIFEIKSRNATDHITRLEEKENEMKHEYKRLHDRYTELLKAHCDYIERMKILHGNDSTHLNSSRSQQQLAAATSSDANVSPTTRQTVSNENHVDTGDVKHTQTESMFSNDAAVNTAKMARMMIGDDISLKEFVTENNHSYLENYKRGIFSKLRSLNLLSAPFDEQQFFVNEDEFEQPTNPNTDSIESDDEVSMDDGKNFDVFDKEIRSEPTDVDASEDLLVRQSFYGMTKEVSNLIKENNELLETKNALNVLKDDLLSKIEELSNEQEILREEVESLQAVKQRLQTRMTDMDDELRKIREELDKKIKEEEGVPTADRKRFTRIEMQRVLVERNHYKQRLFELEEAVHRQDALRASKHEQINSSSTLITFPQPLLDQNPTMIWNFFSGLFGSGIREDSPKPSSNRNTTAISNKQSATTDQQTSVVNPLDSTSDDHLSSQRTINDRFEPNQL